MSLVVRVRIFHWKWSHVKVLQFFCLVRLKLWTKWIIQCWMARQTLPENGYGEWLLDIFGFCHVLTDLAYSFRLILLFKLLQDCACKFGKNPNCEFFSELFWCNFWNLLFLQLFEGLNQYIGAINVRTSKLTVIFADYPPNFDDPHYCHILTLSRGLSWLEILKCTKPPSYARAELIVVTKYTHNEIIKKFHRVFMRIH